MTDSLEDWIKLTVGVNVDIKSYEKQFSNGYYFGEIFFNYGLCSQFDDIFTNKPQPIYRERNFSELVNLMKVIGVDFNEDIIRSVQKEEIGASKKLLYQMKTSLTEYEDNLKLKNKTNRTTAEESLHQRLKAKGAPPPIYKIEANLIRFEEEFVAQKERARQLRVQEEEAYRNLVQSNRQVRRQNLKTNHDYMKEWEKKHYGLWMMTKQEQKEIKDRAKRFADTMTIQLKQREEQLKEKDRSDYYNSLKEFEESANRLGIKLEQDESDDKKQTKTFNPIATKQKIARKVETIEKGRKEKESRLRKVNVQQIQAEKEMERISEERSNMAKYLQYSKASVGSGISSLVESKRMEFVNQKRTDYYNKKDEEFKNEASNTLKKLKVISDEDWEKWCKNARMAKREMMLEKRVEKFEKHYDMCYTIVRRMFDMNEELAKFLKLDEDTGKKGEYKLAQVPEKVYYQLEDKFRKFENFEAKNSLIFQTIEAIKHKSGIEEHQSIVAEESKQILMEYIEGKDKFSPPLTYNYFVKGLKPFEGNAAFSSILTEVLDVAYPMRPKKPLPEEVNSHLPLRILVSAPRDGGAEDIANQFNKELGLKLIDIEELKSSALLLLKEKEEQDRFLAEEEGLKEDDTLAAKKKPSKKVAKTKFEPREFSEDELRLCEIASRLKEYNRQYLNIETPPETESQMDDPKTNRSRRKMEDIKVHELNIAEQADHLFDSQPPSQMMQSELDVDKIDEEGDGGKVTELCKIIFDLFNHRINKIFPQRTLMDMHGKLVQKRKWAEEESVRLKTEKQAIVAKVEAPPKSTKAKGKRGKKEEPKEEAVVEEIKPIVDIIRFPFIDGYVVFNLPVGKIFVEMFDKMLTNYVEREERLNKKAEKKREKVSNVMKINEREEENDAFPAFDIVLTLKPDFEMIKAKLSEYKIDPSTGLIYNEKNPLPTNDKKLLERVIPLEIDFDNLKQEYDLFEDSKDFLHYWYSKFGWKGEDSVVIQPLETVEPEEHNRKAIEKVSNRIQSILQVKYKIYEEFEKYNDIYYEKINFEEFDDASSRVSIQISQRMERPQFQEVSSDHMRKSGNRKSLVSMSRRLESKSAITKGTRQDKILKKCISAMKKVLVNYIEDITRNFRQLHDVSESNTEFLMRIQKLFTDFMKRDSKTQDRVDSFIQSYQGFVTNEKGMLDGEIASYAKQKISGLLDSLNDFYWESLQQKKNRALKEKEELDKMRKLEEMVNEYLKLYLNIMGCELNKIFFMKEMMVQYFFYKNFAKDKGEGEYNFELKKLDFVNDVLPDIDFSEILPLERMDYIEEKIVSFFDDFEDKMNSNQDRLPAEFIKCFQLELSSTRERVSSIRRYICHLIRREKLRYTNLLHRIEDWVVDSIKEESNIIYSFAKDMRNKIELGKPFSKDTISSFDPIALNQMIDYSLGPNIILPEEDYESPDYFCLTQLVLVLTDIRNWYSKNSTISLSYLVNKINFRRKRIHLGYLSYLPTSWHDYTISSLTKILAKLCLPSTTDVVFEDLALVLILLRYPMPTEENLENLKVNISKISTSIEDFLALPTWMDQFDERLETNLEPMTIYKTVYTKKLLFWLFSRKEEFMPDQFTSTLKRFVTRNTFRTFGDFLLN